MNEEDEQVILDLFAKYDGMKAAKKKEEEEKQTIFNATVDTKVKEKTDELTAAYEEKLKEFMAKKEVKENEELEGSMKGNETKDDKEETFNAVENKDDGYVSMTQSKEWATRFCSKTMIDKGMKLEPNSFVPKPYEQMMVAYEKYGIESFLAVDSDSGCDDVVDAWQCEDCFVDSIMYAVICKSVVHISSIKIQE